APTDQSPSSPTISTVPLISIVRHSVGIIHNLAVKIRGLFDLSLSRFRMMLGLHHPGRNRRHAPQHERTRPTRRIRNNRNKQRSHRKPLGSLHQRISSHREPILVVLDLTTSRAE